MNIRNKLLKAMRKRRIEIEEANFGRTLLHLGVEPDDIASLFNDIEFDFDIDIDPHCIGYDNATVNNLIAYIEAELGISQSAS